MIIFSLPQANAQKDTLPYSLELISIDTVEVVKNKPPIELKHHFKYLTDISGGNVKIAGIMSYLPVEPQFGGMIDYEDFKRYNDYSFRTIELPNGKSFTTKYCNRIFANVEAERIYNYGTGYMINGEANKEYNLIFLDFEGNVLNSYGDKYLILDQKFVNNGDMIANCIIYKNNANTESALCYFDKDGSLLWKKVRKKGSYLQSLTVSNTGKYVAFVEVLNVNQKTDECSQIMYILNKTGDIIYEKFYKTIYYKVTIGDFSEDERYVYYSTDKDKGLLDIVQKKTVFNSQLGFYNYKIDQNHDRIYCIAYVSRGVYSINIHDLSSSKLLAKETLPKININSTPKIKEISSFSIKIEQSNIQINYQIYKNENN